MYFPTEKHKEYMEYIKKICNQNRISLVLEGSLAHGTAKPFSDIDLLLCGTMNAIMLDDIISGYDNIVMTNRTEKPMGICILNYKNGISVDLDIRKCVLSSEIENNVILCDYGFKTADTIKRNIILSNYMPERPSWYKAIRLIHRCSIKFLCGKTDAAKDLADEVSNAVYSLTNQNVMKSNHMKQRMKDSLQYLNKSKSMQLIKSIIDLIYFKKWIVFS